MSSHQQDKFPFSFSSSPLTEIPNDGHSLYYMLLAFMMENKNFYKDFDIKYHVMEENKPLKATALLTPCKPRSRTKKFKISLVPQIGGFFSDLSAEDNLNSIGEILIKDTKSRKLKIEELISKFELDAVRKVEAKFLSGGMKRRLVISMSLLGEPDILLMDEPLAALDPQTIQMLQTIIIKLQSEYNLTILITDHQARDLLVVCDKAIILSNSKIVAEGTPNELIKNENATKYYFGDNFKFK